VRSGKKKREPTGNEAIIRAAMKVKGIRGNPRDYVLLMGDRLLECTGSFAMFQVNEDQSESKRVEFEGVQLVHKKHLHKYAAEPVAAKFWNRKLGVRVPQVKKPRKAKRTEKG
jgi:hypothetical protein